MFLKKHISNLQDSANFSPFYFQNSHIFFAKRAAPPAPLPLRAKKLRFFAFRGRASLSPLLAKNRRLHFCNLAPDFLHHEAGEFSGASHKYFLDSVESQNLIENTLRGSILEIKSGFCETSDKDKTKVYRGSELKQSTILARKTNAQ